MEAPSISGTGLGSSGTGFGSASNFSNVENDFQLSTTQQQNSTSQYGTAIAGGEGSNINTTLSDSGAIAAGLALGSLGITTASLSAQKTVDAAILGIQKSSEILLNKSESDITKFFKPLIWLALIVAAVIIFFFWTKRRDDKKEK